MRPNSWKDLIAEVSRITGKPEDQVKAIVQAYYKEVQSSMTSLAHISINVRELGVFRIKPVKLGEEIEKLERINKTMDTSTMKNYSIYKSNESRISQLSGLKERYSQENEKRKKLRELRYGKSTTDTNMEKQG